MPLNDLNDYKNKSWPAFQLSYVEGNTIHSKDLIGKPTLINFWFTNCTPCIEEMPTLNAIKREFGNRVNFIAITYEDTEQVTDFMSNHAFDFIQVVEAEKYLRQFGFFGYPRTIILDKSFTLTKVVKNVIPKEKEKVSYSKFKSEILQTLNQLLESENK